MNGIVLPHWVVSAVVHCPGGAYPSYVQGHYARDNGFYQRWDAIARDREGFRTPGWSGTCSAAVTTPRSSRAWGQPHERLDARRDDDRGRVAPAVGRLRVLRRHRPAERRLQPRATDPRAGHRAGLRVRHARHASGRAAAVHRRRRARRHRGLRRAAAGDLQLLPAGGPRRRGVPRRRADRPSRQPQQHRDRAVRRADHAPARRGRRDGDRGPRAADLRDAQGHAAQPGRHARLPHQRAASSTATARARAPPCAAPARAP